ncbi:MAG: hypothetical protein WDA06_04390 [Phenylobacterium sp.]
MPPADRERALRRAVAQLAAVDPDDVEDVLAELDEAQRERVRALLAEWLGGVLPQAGTPGKSSAKDIRQDASRSSGPPRPSLVGLSAGLASRIEAAETSARRDGRNRIGPVVTGPFRLTSAAAEALWRLAVELQPPAELVEDPPPPPRPSWRDRLPRLPLLGRLPA